LAWSVLLSVGYGLATEAMQQLQALGRHGDVNDAIANTLGAAAGAVHLGRRWNRERSGGSAKVA
jgi:VanZ family protein